jgi:uncharacterized protein (TIGR02466 family)
MNIRNNIISTFPKHILCLDNICLDHLEDFKQGIMQVLGNSGSKTSDLLNVQSTHKTNADLHEYQVFDPLTSCIEQIFPDFAMFLGYDPLYAMKLNIANMWANVSDQGGYNFPHTHSGSIISGVFYVESIEENNLVFFDNYINMEFPINASGEGYDRLTFQCKPGRLIMFRGDFPHGAPPQQGPGRKIAISFNIVR